MSRENFKKHSSWKRKKIIWTDLMPRHLIPSDNICQLFWEFHWSCVSACLPRPLLPWRLLLPRGRLLFRLLVVAVVVAAVVRPLSPFLRWALLCPPLLPAALVVRLEFCFALLGGLASAWVVGCTESEGIKENGKNLRRFCDLPNLPFNNSVSPLLIFTGSSGS